MLKLTRKGNRLSLSGELKVQHLDEVTPVLVEVASSPGQVVLDIGRVTEVDAAGLQLLLSFIKSRSQSPTNLEGLTPSFQRALELMGLEDSFQALLA